MVRRHDADASRASLSSPWLALRSIVAAVALPGMVVGYVPWRFFGLRSARIDLQNPAHWLALLCIAIGGALLAICIREFAASGRGTLAPVDPPRELVVRGLYRYTRNPMYLSVAAVLAGEVLLTGSRGLVTFAAVWFILANLFVIGYEEPALRRRFGASYAAHMDRVGRWLPRR